eukprot:c35272_g1_i1 orf=137-961(+)
MILSGELMVCCVVEPASMVMLRRVVSEVKDVSSQNDAVRRTGPGARDRRLLKVKEEKRWREMERKTKYPDWARIVEEACKNDLELREIVGDSFGNPEEMQRRIEERVRKKGRNALQPNTGSAVPVGVSFRDFDPTNSYIWLELYSAPSDKAVETIGSVLQSWYLLGRLGSFNCLNLQLTHSPIHTSLSYNHELEESLPAFFHNIGDLEFQDNWGRFWVDLGTSDPLALDVLINCLIAVSSEHVGIKQLIFGGNCLGDWEEGMTSEEDGYKVIKI